MSTVDQLDTWIRGVLDHATTDITPEQRLFFLQEVKNSMNLAQLMLVTDHLARQRQDMPSDAPATRH